MKDSFVQKLGFEEPDEPKFYGIEPQQTARAIMLELRTKDGRSKAFAYSYLTQTAYDPEVGIVIHVSDAIVTIKGRCLDEIYRYLIVNRLCYIQEDFSGTDIADEELFVEAIEIKARDDSFPL